MFKPVSPKVDFPALERELLKKWYDAGIVQQYLHRNDSVKQQFSFLDGPITANNPMGVHHAWGRTYKDLWQRFWNMRGYKERFQNGFDCQGLWVEVEVEKELGIKNKKEIENLVPGNKKESIAKFVQLCKDRVLKFSAIQTEQSKRLGYFMDWDHSYYTMSDENNYMIWYFLKVCHEKGWIYKGRDSVPWCPRCETAISQHEMLTEDYRELTHETVFVKLPIVSSGFENTSLLIWTTTPWTVPANVGVGVNTKYMYGVWEEMVTKEKIIFVSKDENGKEPIRLQKGKEIPVSGYIFSGLETSFHKIKEVSGKELVGLRYIAPFDQLPLVQKAQKEHPDTFHTVVDGSEIVVAHEGTGLLHVAPGAGKEDFDLGKKEHLSVISPIADDASYIEGMEEFSGKNAKKHPELIIDYLKTHENGKFLLKTMHYTHRYPACWRCKTELVWKVTNEWYIAMDIQSKSKIKNQKSKLEKGETFREQMMKVAKQINWHPEWGLERELDWLQNMHDWLISKKNRYWGLALPIYECKKCGAFEVIGSKEELQKKAVKGWDTFEGHTPHKPYIDEVKIRCPKCSEMVSRIDDVGNVWLDAGIVPFSTLIDPRTGKVSYMTDKTYWRKWFPFDFVTESFPGQFKNWFYALIAMSTALEKRAPFKSLLGFASVRDEKGEEMHKSKGNAIEFNQAADSIGVDVMRWMYARQDPERNLNFGAHVADEVRRQFHLMLWNVYNFFLTNALIDNWRPETMVPNPNVSVLDKWILSRLQKTIRVSTTSLEDYDSASACLSIENFVQDLSLWYVRRSRDRIGISADNQEDKQACYQTLYEVLLTLCRLLAPFTPFIADGMYINLTGQKSVHLSDWPKENSEFRIQNSELTKQMELARKLVEVGHSIRKEQKLKIRQPLGLGWHDEPKEKITNVEILRLVLEELNIKNWIHPDNFEKFTKNKYVVSKEIDGMTFWIDTNLTNELKAEGEARDIVRHIQEERKKLGTRLDEQVNIALPTWPKEFEEYIKKKALVRNLAKSETFAVKRI